MFLCLEEKMAEEDERVGIVVAMHGEAAATSIADVSNRLLGEDCVLGYNMPWTKSLKRHWRISPRL